MFPNKVFWMFSMDLLGVGPVAGQRIQVDPWNKNEADVHRLDHILRGEVGVSCNSMPLEHNLLVTG